MSRCLEEPMLVSVGPSVAQVKAVFEVGQSIEYCSLTWYTYSCVSDPEHSPIRVSVNDHDRPVEVEASLPTNKVAACQEVEPIHFELDSNAGVLWHGWYKPSFVGERLSLVPLVGNIHAHCAP